MRYSITLFIITLLTIVSCSTRPMKVSQLTEHCFYIPNYDKTVCLETKYDSLYPVLYIDKNPLEFRKNKFNGLKLYLVMVVEKDEKNITFSNINYSVKVSTTKFNDSCINIQDMYYIIIKREHLTKTKIVLDSEGVYIPKDSESNDAYEDTMDYGEYGSYDEEP